jgi:hypothetical protein
VNHSYDSVFERKLQRLFAFEFSGPQPSAAYFLRRSGLTLRIFDRNPESLLVISFGRDGAGYDGPAQPPSATPLHRSFASRLVTCFAPKLFSLSGIRSESRRVQPRRGKGLSRWRICRWKLGKPRTAVGTSSPVWASRRCSRNAHISPVGQIALSDRHHLGRRRRRQDWAQSIHRLTKISPRG